MALTNDLGHSKEPLQDLVSKDLTPYFNNRFGKENVIKADAFTKEAGDLIDNLSETCKRYNISNADKVFSFIIENGQYQLFISYDSLIDAINLNTFCGGT